MNNTNTNLNDISMRLTILLGDASAVLTGELSPIILIKLEEASMWLNRAMELQG